ncbi:MAG: hypothetical protein EOO28_25385 [Comamonadaceae bacterium]|nr:MAG: hypothetical protein EOO28_25385 [Comamonadaceae bacterium]
MKILRILTGPHAGARVALTDGRWTITGQQHAAQFPLVGTLCLEGWSTHALVLDVVDGVCSIVEPVPGESAGLPYAGETVAWQDLEPRRFGRTVLCTGEAGTAWPDDLALLSRLVQPAGPAAVTAPGTGPVPLRPGMPGSRFGALLSRIAPGGRYAVVMVCVATLLALVTASPANFAKSVRTTLRHDAFFPADDAASAAAVLQASMSWRKPGSAKGSLSDAEVLDIVRSALHGRGLTISSEGDGRLVIVGQAREPGQIKEIAGRLLQDLSPELKSLDVEALPAVARSRVSARLEAGNTAYAVRPDGTKMFSQ